MSSGTSSANYEHIVTLPFITDSREYTPEGLRRLGLDYYKRHNDHGGTPYAEVYENADGTYTVRVYSYVFDGVTEHATTWAYYVVDSTRKGEETSMGGYVDLTQ